MIRLAPATEWSSWASGMRSNHYGNPLDRLTVKAQEAMQRASELASEHGNSEVVPLHLPGSAAGGSRGIVCLCWRAPERRPRPCMRSAARDCGLPKLAKAAAQPSSCGCDYGGCLTLRSRAAADFKDEYVLHEHLLLGLIGLKVTPRRSF